VLLVQSLEGNEDTKEARRFEFSGLSQPRSRRWPQLHRFLIKLATFALSETLSLAARNGSFLVQRVPSSHTSQRLLLPHSATDYQVGTRVILCPPK
jgi:hypothetical protein